MKTAIQELINSLVSDRDSEVSVIAKQAIQECIITATSYLETEKQQIIEAFGTCCNCEGTTFEGSEYYKETFEL